MNKMSEGSIRNGSNDNDPPQPVNDPVIDGNNNILPLNDNDLGQRSFLDSIGITKLPPASTIFSAILMIVYMVTSVLGLKEKSILVSWDSVIVEGQYWRLLVAHLFHFNKVNLFVNCISLMTMGRYIEKRIKTVAMLSIIQLMGAVSNFIYILISNFLSSDSAYSSTFGFAHVLFGSRILMAYAQEPRNYRVALFFGLYPMYLPVQWSPWEPVLETAILKLAMPELNVTGRAAALLAGFLLSFGVKMFSRCWIYHRRRVLHNTVSGLRRTRSSSHVTFALRMVQIFSKDENNSQMPTLVLGFWPVYFPDWFAPWEPLAERLLTDALKRDRGLATHMAGIFAGLIFPHLANQFGSFIVRESGTTLTSLYEHELCEGPAAEQDSIDSFVNEFLGRDLTFPVKRAESSLELAFHPSSPPNVFEHSEINHGHHRNSVPAASLASGMPNNAENSTQEVGHPSSRE